MNSSADSPQSNVAEFSVSEISGSIKRTVENAFGHVRVRGEVSGYRGPHSSGHAYFSLKDDRARIEAVIWRGVFSKLRFKPEEGMEVIATGRITTYPGSSKYQIVIEELEPAGAGALMQMLEERRKKLAAEGLFDEARKQLLPFMPRVIGVVTSPTGAVIRDILHRIADRFPVHVVVWPVRVQGETSGDEVANAINGFNALPDGGPIARPDLLIVARGGGSLEDLWGFNDEAVVRAAAASHIPLISAVGHETDWTLIDHVADRRAPTPTGAAEIAVPVKAELEAALANITARHRAGLTRFVDRHRQNIRALARALPTPDSILALPRRRMDETATGLDRSMQIALTAKRARFDQAVARLTPTALRSGLRDRAGKIAETMARLDRLVERRTDRVRSDLNGWRRALDLAPARIERVIAQDRQNLAVIARRSDAASKIGIERSARRLGEAGRVLATLSYENVLMRGYAVVRDADDRPVASASALGSGEAISLQMRDGRVGAITTGGDAPKPKPKAKSATGPKPPPPKQGSLF